MDISHEQIEGAFKPAKNLTDKLGDSTEAKRAADHLRMAEGYAHEARERSKHDTHVEIDASAEMQIRYHAVVAALSKPEYLPAACPMHGAGCTHNNAQIPGWPYTSSASRWTWRDGSAP